MMDQLKKIINQLKRKYELRKYDDYTIEDYFRKHGWDIGRNNRICIRSFGREPFLVTIGNHCNIAREVSLMTHDGAVWIFRNEDPTLQKFGKIEIKDNCFIGFRSIILPNVTIGPNSIVGAGSVVTRDVPPNTIVAGNPAKIIGSVDNYKDKAIKIWEKQRPKGYLSGIESSSFYPPEYIQKLRIEQKTLLNGHLIKIMYAKDNE